MPAKLYRVNLTEAEREHLLGITRRGKSSGRKVKRSLILCKADEGLTDQQVAEALMVGPSTVGRGNGANLMESRKPTWWPWPAARPRKGTPAGRCDCWPTKR